VMLKAFVGDLHIHTCLSPCAELEMTPINIVRTCIERRIDMIAICDHNSAENVAAVQRAAEMTELTVLAGMEITTSEEIHILALFDSADDAELLQRDVYSLLTPGKNDEELFGIQVVANEVDEVEGIVDRLLIGSVDLTLDETIDRIHRSGGLAIASHIDRNRFSLTSQLGLIPDDLNIDALEISSSSDIEEVVKGINGAEKFPLLRSSDAHTLDIIGSGVTRFYIEDSTIDEIRMALRNENGRNLIV